MPRPRKVLSGILQGKKFLLSKFSVGPHFSKLVPYWGGKGDSRTTAPILPAGPHPACGRSLKNSEICSAIAGCRKRRVRRMFRRFAAAVATSREGHRPPRSDLEVRHRRWGRERQRGRGY